MSASLWHLEHVTLNGGRHRRLDDLTLEIHAGSTAVIGYSGAGKTSLLNLLAEFERPDGGTIARTTNLNADARLPVYWVPENDGLWPHLSAAQHLRTVAPDTASANRCLEQFDLGDRANAAPATLSRGERSRLALARAVCSGAAILVLDEPLAHVDPARAGTYWQILREHCRATETSIVFATHQPEQVLMDAERVICLKGGRAVYSGEVEELYYRPPDAELAAFLGPANWIASDASEWLTGAGERACYRPEQVSVVPDREGRMRVEWTRFAGSFAEVELVNESTGSRRRFVHRPSQDQLRKGDRVCVRVNP